MTKATEEIVTRNLLETDPLYAWPMESVRAGEVYRRHFAACDDEALPGRVIIEGEVIFVRVNFAGEIVRAHNDSGHGWDSDGSPVYPREDN